MGYKSHGQKASNYHADTVPRGDSRQVQKELGTHRTTMQAHNMPETSCNKALVYKQRLSDH